MEKTQQMWPHLATLDAQQNRESSFKCKKYLRKECNNTAIPFRNSTTISTKLKVIPNKEANEIELSMLKQFHHKLNNHQHKSKK